jgi:CMP-N,N'-diacetyllegionaminic acid synthase
MISILPNICWGLMPARGGSKSIPYKNIAPLGGRALINYSILAAEACPSISRMICSTDSTQISNHCDQLKVEVHDRPKRLAEDASPVYDMIEHFLNDMCEKEGAVAEFIALLQPTSPFLLPEHIERCVDALVKDKEAASAQTVIECPHNSHAFNQRIISNGYLDFKFSEERKAAYNKQTKPNHYLFGNLIVFRSSFSLEQKSVFPMPSYPVLIEPPYNFDADGPEDFRIADLMIKQKLVILPHLNQD